MTGWILVYALAAVAACQGFIIRRLRAQYREERGINKFLTDQLAMLGLASVEYPGGAAPKKGGSGSHPVCREGIGPTPFGAQRCATDPVNSPPPIFNRGVSNGTRT